MSDRCPKTGKVIYPTRDDATAALAAQQNRPLPRLLRIYRCPSCKRWHLGNHSPRPRRRKN